MVKQMLFQASLLSINMTLETEGKFLYSLLASIHRLIVQEFFIRIVKDEGFIIVIG